MEPVRPIRSIVLLFGEGEWERGRREGEVVVDCESERSKVSRSVKVEA
jgi:hypothetical protein